MSGRHVFSESEKTILKELIIKYNLNSIATMEAGNPCARKSLWVRLTEEFNSIDSNSRRTEAQLKKCWDNLKTKRKKLLSEERRQRMRTGGGPYDGPSTSQDAQGIDALTNQTDVEIPSTIDSDFSPPVVSQEILITDARPDSQDSDINQGAVATEHYPVSGNIRTQVIQKEFHLREKIYNKNKKKEDEIHELRIAEKKLLVKAAEEAYAKNKLEREAAEINLRAAEELRRCNQALREAAEHELAQKRIGTLGVDCISSSGHDYDK